MSQKERPLGNLNLTYILLGNNVVASPFRVVSIYRDGKTNKMLNA